MKRESENNEVSTNIVVNGTCCHEYTADDLYCVGINGRHWIHEPTLIGKVGVALAHGRMHGFDHMHIWESPGQGIQEMGGQHPRRSHILHCAHLPAIGHVRIDLWNDAI
jgi:hypothetical protein